MPKDLTLFMAVAFGWVVLVTLVSIVYRLNRGKPIAPKAPGNAIFVQRGASGGSGFGGASNCLLVYVTPTELCVTPTFPFTLMFVAEFYGLELTLTPRQIAEATILRRWWGKRVIIHRADGGKAFRLKLRNPDALADALREIGVRVLDAKG